MKYALLVHLDKETVEQFKDANAKTAARAAGMAYGEALRAAGIFVAGAGLEPPHTATVVSVQRRKTPSPRWPVCRDQGIPRRIRHH